MAIVDDFFTASQFRQPFQAPTPEVERRGTPIPRALYHFSLFEATQAKPLNDQHHLQIAGVFPDNYGYRFAQFSVVYVSDTAHDWHARGHLTFTNGTPGLPPGSTGIGQQMGTAIFLEDTYELAAATAATEAWQSRIISYDNPRLMIFNPSEAIPSWKFQAENLNTAAEAAGEVRLQISFWEYDLSQAVQFAPNMPAPFTTQ